MSGDREGLGKCKTKNPKQQIQRAKVKQEGHVNQALNSRLLLNNCSCHKKIHVFPKILILIQMMSWFSYHTKMLYLLIHFIIANTLSTCSSSVIYLKDTQQLK